MSTLYEENKHWPLQIRATIVFLVASILSGVLINLINVATISHPAGYVYGFIFVWVTVTLAVYLRWSDDTERKMASLWMIPIAGYFLARHYAPQFETYYQKERAKRTKLAGKYLEEAIRAKNKAQQGEHLDSSESIAKNLREAFKINGDLEEEDARTHLQIALLVILEQAKQKRTRALNKWFGLKAVEKGAPSILTSGDMGEDWVEDIFREVPEGGSPLHLGMPSTKEITLAEVSYREAINFCKEVVCWRQNSTLTVEVLEEFIEKL